MKRNYYKYLLSCVSGVALLFMQTHIANAADTNVNASAKPLKSCTIASIDPINFGEIQFSNISAQYKDATLRITCSNSVKYNVSPDSGSNSTDPYKRFLSNANGDTLFYTLHYKKEQDQSRYLWHTKADVRYSTDETVSGTGTGNEQSHTMLGRIFSDDISRLPGSAYGTNFTDQVTLTLELAG